MNDPRAAGEDLFKRDPELMLAEVAWAADKAFEAREDYEAFIDAYVNARKRKWEYEQERREP